MPGQARNDNRYLHVAQIDAKRVLHGAPFAATDFLARNIWEVDAFSKTLNVVFRVRVSKDSGLIQRVVMLYRRTDANAWPHLDLTDDPASGWATGVVPMLPAPIEYFAQAVDPTGNVAFVLDHSDAFIEVGHGAASFLPIIRC